MKSKITYYDWIPYFKAIAIKMFEISKDKSNRDSLLLNLANELFEEGTAILNFSITDPFSIIYSIAQKNTKNQRKYIFESIKAVCGLEENLPTDFTFPTPTPNTKSLFFFNGHYVDGEGIAIGNDCLWNLFHQVYNGEEINNDDFLKVLALKNVGVTKLTQAMFLINPNEYMPFDTQMNKLPVDSLDNLKLISLQIEEDGVLPYYDVLSILKSNFPGCYYYEINLLNYLLNTTTGEQLRVSNTYCQVSSNAQGQNEGDYFDDFVDKNGVYTGSAFLNEHTKYPLQDYKPGDVVLVRRGTKRLGGIGLIVNNEYLPNGYDDDLMIKIIWLVKDNRKIQSTALGQWDGFSHATANTVDRFKECYPETFKILDYTRNKQKTMVNHSAVKFKNLILQGPPGTGKTRLAKQIAEWLTDETSDKEKSILEAIENKMFSKEPEVEENPCVEVIQFHPSYTYDDFVRGVKVNVVDEKISYDVENKILGQMAFEAAKPENQDKAFVLIIDEINRANLNSVLGELIYALEYRGKMVNSMYKTEQGYGITIPHNLYVIGTMNTADRSVSHLDYAIRRRFTFIPVPVNDEVITNVESKKVFNVIRNIVKNNISPEFNVDDIQVGHSYFLVEGKDLYYKTKYEVIPLLNEYINDGILLPSAEDEIKELLSNNF
ncbi:McrB family protein [Lutibacter sp. B1]|uniref:McrB family protein n=1 Tax=Lutibacter sp. B1 TaxID=2725996 RepID=UPI0014577E03|nr:AAA family ATPase [Lutibacter sp. B1]NLP57501.1 AAA domain-containing protein [Lutibacter sp. B1]